MFNEGQVAVTLTKPFWLGKTEVTQGQWQQVMGTAPWDGKDNVQIDNNGAAYPHAVGLKKPNPWGLHDMYGNVWEWCSDWYGKLPGGADPVGPEGGSDRVYRGGGSPSSSRSASRRYSDPSSRRDYLGFRVARSQSAQ